MFSFCAVADECVALTNGWPVALPVASSLPYRARHAHFTAGITSVCDHSEVQLVCQSVGKFNVVRNCSKYVDSITLYLGLSGNKNTYR